MLFRKKNRNEFLIFERFHDAIKISEVIEISSKFQI